MNLKLSDKFTIYKFQDLDFSSKKQECLNVVKLNDKLSTHTNDNSVWMEVSGKCFREINTMVKTKIESITQRKFINYAEHYWIYTQKKGFDLEWMHQHLLVHPSGRSKILTDYTFTYYLQIPKDTVGNEGCIVFETEDKIRHKFLPQEGDIFIFPADIRHTAIPTPNSVVERIVYAGSFCIDIENQNINLKNLI